MFTRVSSLPVALVLVLVLVSGCGEAPVAEYDKGQASLEDARLAEADLYAPELMAQASDSLTAAGVEMAKQDESMVMFRDYDRSLALISTAERLTAQALDSTTARKESVRLEDSTLLAELQTLIADTRTSLASAPRGKGSRVDIKVMQADIDAAANALTAASEKVNQGKYLEAKSQLNAVKSQVLKVQESIKAASSKAPKG